MLPKVMNYVGNKTREQLKPFPFWRSFQWWNWKSKNKEIVLFCCYGKKLLKKSHENLNYNLVLDNGYRKSSFKYGITHHSRILGHNMTNTPLGWWNYMTHTNTMLALHTNFGHEEEIKQ
jgi:hypothetical protein